MFQQSFQEGGSEHSEMLPLDYIAHGGSKTELRSYLALAVYEILIFSRQRGRSQRKPPRQRVRRPRIRTEPPSYRKSIFFENFKGYSPSIFSEKKVKVLGTF